MEVWLGIVGTLLGAVSGGAISFVTQRASYNREATERLAGLRRDAYLGYLSATHEMFGAIGQLQRQARDGDLDSATVSSQLRAIDASRGQDALECLRLVASEPVASAAAHLWERMRRDNSPIGRDVGWRAFTTWRHSYWKARRELLDAARRDTGLQALDWSTAGLR